MDLFLFLENPRQYTAILIAVSAPVFGILSWLDGSVRTGAAASGFFILAMLLAIVAVKPPLKIGLPLLLVAIGLFAAGVAVGY